MIGQYDRLSVVLKNVWRRGKERLKSSCRRRLLGNLFREDGPADQCKTYVLEVVAFLGLVEKSAIMNIRFCCSEVKHVTGA